MSRMLEADRRKTIRGRSPQPRRSGGRGNGSGSAIREPRAPTHHWNLRWEEGEPGPLNHPLGVGPTAFRLDAGEIPGACAPPRMGDERDGERLPVETGRTPPGIRADPVESRSEDAV